MKLYLIRHGISEEAREGMNDEDRQLTNEGRQELISTLRSARATGFDATLILTSPLVRAVQTAEIAARELGYRHELVPSRALIPEGRISDVWEEIRTHRDEKELLLASHNPLCASLVGYLLGTPRLTVRFRKGAILRVDFESFGPEPRGVLQWFLPPLR
ncbi:MAG: phosphohistidine phosphatase SixA [Bryobacteraceae bacterium]|nr:phosphohistidine phosphatase SixA [Bryobacteraceae bacterium]